MIRFAIKNLFLLLKLGIKKLINDVLDFFFNFLIYSNLKKKNKRDSVLPLIWQNKLSYLVYPPALIKRAKIRQDK